MNDPGLWLIRADSAAELTGLYPPPPAGTILRTQVRGSTVLSADGELFSIATESANPGRDLIVRRTIDGTSEIVYDEDDDPLVKLHASSLVTGP